jgi:hypothetical protein
MGSVDTEVVTQSRSLGSDAAPLNPRFFPPPPNAAPTSNEDTRHSFPTISLCLSVTAPRSVVGVPHASHYPVGATVMRVTGARFRQVAFSGC